MANYTGVKKIKIGDNTFEIALPSKVSELTNDSGFITTYTNTKNTAGSTDTSSKIYLVGAKSQAANPQTYSHDTAYVGTDGCLYSNSTKVSVEGHTHSYVPTSRTINSKALSSNITLAPSDLGVSDYINENGSTSSNSGRYRKTNNGWIEFWARVENNSGLTTTKWNNVYYADSTSFSNLWSGVFSATPKHVFATSNNSQIISIIPFAWDKNGITSLRFISAGVLSNAAYSFSIYAIQA